MKTKNLLITGASSGIGHETVRFFAARGWKVAATMRNPKRAGDLNNIPGVAIYTMDVTQPHNVEQTLEKAWQDMGGIDVVVNNAGYGALGIFEGAGDEQIIRQMDTNLLGILRVTRNILPLMRQRGKGTIINVSSIAGRMGLPIYSLYNASKFAVEGFTESLFYELHPFNIKVRLIEPGPVKTDFNNRSKDEILPPDDDKYIALSQKATHFYNHSFKHAAKPEVVARTIYRAATSKTNRLRFPAGFQSWLFLLAYQLLPGSWFRWLTRFLINI
ncbi:SDR family oxidoreductase [Marinilabilia rubra]|uniref:Oxidoreductase n=1 Tax=Marinilabilia rubra TaxID=2162893 RepID=A0A2U2B7C0_9BACT|nr:SDR family oxidoreductase [Marinilabilia rubra]PWD98970.1 oxidoreductase [Marinilabilia rubra]